MALVVRCEALEIERKRVERGVGCYSSERLTDVCLTSVLGVLIGLGLWMSLLVPTFG